MTLYRLYSDNGNRAGFWVQHRSWRNVCAQVQSIAGQCEGALPSGEPPEQTGTEVRMRVFDVRSGRPVFLQPAFDGCHDRNYSRIAEPSWTHARH